VLCTKSSVLHAIDYMNTTIVLWTWCTWVLAICFIF